MAIEPLTLDDLIARIPDLVVRLGDEMVDDALPAFYRTTGFTFRDVNATVTVTLTIGKPAGPRMRLELALSVNSDGEGDDDG